MYASWLACCQNNVLWLSCVPQLEHSSVVQVCYYRDKQSINKFQIASVKAADGGSKVTISEPFALDTKWNYKVGDGNCHDFGRYMT